MKIEIAKDNLMKALQDVSIEKTISTRSGKITYQEFSLRPVKPLIDDVDRLLAQHYGFTAEELDYILNYDIKYRMGDELFSDEGEEGD